MKQSNYKLKVLLPIFILFSTKIFSMNLKDTQNSFTKFKGSLVKIVSNKDILSIKKIYIGWEEKGIKISDEHLSMIIKGLNDNVLTQKPIIECKENACALVVKDKHTTTTTKFIYKNNKWLFDTGN